MAAKPRAPRSIRRHRGGVAAVEFALIAPILLACLVGVYDLGAALQQYIHLQQAVRAGGLYAMSYPDDNAATFTSSITSAVKAATPDWTNITVSSTSITCMCWTSATNTYGAAITCPAISTSTTCAAGASLQRFVSVNATRPFSALFYSTLSTTSASYVARIQ